MGHSQRLKPRLPKFRVTRNRFIVDAFWVSLVTMAIGCDRAPTQVIQVLDSNSKRAAKEGEFNFAPQKISETESGRWYGFWFHGKAIHESTKMPSLRLVTEDHVLEVFSRDSGGAGFESSHQSVPINWRLLPEGQRWVVVELWGTDFGLLRGEVDRWGPFALVELPWNAQAHEWLANHALHVSELETFEGEFLHETLELSPASSAGAAVGSSKSTGKMSLGGGASFLSSLENKVKEFSGASPLGGSQRISERGSDKGRMLARDWLRQEFTRLGYAVSEHTYRGRFSEGVNLIAERPGSEFSKTLVVSSHYDSVGNPGADDNGAGVVGMLSIAEKLQDRQLSFNLRMVFFDQEEKGLVGSKAYVDHLKAQGQLDQILGNINFEMLGYDSNGDGALHIIDCNENTSAQLSSRVMKTLTQKPDLGLQRVAACTNRSDHANFWRYGVPAIVVSENFFGGDGNPCYHKTCDQTNQMNFLYMGRIVELMAETIAQLEAP